MKIINKRQAAFFAVLLFGTLSLGAAPKPEWTRSLSFYGAGLYWDPVDPGAGPGVSLEGQTFTYLNPDNPDGFYLGLLTNASYHQRGSQISLDDHLVTVGYWGDLGPGVPFSWTANGSPVLGSRSNGTVLLGSAYFGIGATLGVFYDVLPGLGLGLTWAPVFNLTTNGAAQAPDQSYHEFSLVVVVKQLAQTKPWEDGLK